MDCCIPQQNLCINQGASFSECFTWIGQIIVQGCVQPGPINISGYTAKMQIRPFQQSPTILFDCSPYLTLGGQYGTILLALPPSVTASFTWFSGVYDLLMTAPGGAYAARIMGGEVTVSPGVSQ